MPLLAISGDAMTGSKEQFRINGVTLVHPQLTLGSYSVGDLVFAEESVYFIMQTRFPLVLSWLEGFLGAACFYYRTRKRRWASALAISKTEPLGRSYQGRSLEELLQALPGSLRIARASIMRMKSVFWPDYDFVIEGGQERFCFDLPGGKRTYKQFRTRLADYAKGPTD